MTRSEYVDRVLSVMRHVTTREREAIRAEIDAHIEDHICDLLELDYPEDLAEERTMALMGDPEEVGRELDKQYTSRIWGRLETVAVAFLIVLVIQAVLGFGILFHARDHLIARVAPEEAASEEFEVEAVEDARYRVKIGNDILKIYQVRVGKREVINWKTGDSEVMRVAELSVCAYDQIPFGIVSGELMRNLEMKDQRGESREEFSGENIGSNSWGAAYEYQYIPIQADDTYVRLTYDRFGEYVELQIPLPEVAP